MKILNTINIIDNNNGVCSFLSPCFSQRIRAILFAANSASTRFFFTIASEQMGDREREREYAIVHLPFGHDVRVFMSAVVWMKWLWKIGFLNSMWRAVVYCCRCSCRCYSWDRWLWTHLAGSFFAIFTLHPLFHVLFEHKIIFFVLMFLLSLLSHAYFYRRRCVGSLRHSWFLRVFHSDQLHIHCVHNVKRTCRYYVRRPAKQNDKLA